VSCVRLISILTISRSIVSGLRSEEDEESIYNGRTSFSSEYSTGTQGDREWENVQVSVKEQTRSNSRGSFSSSALKSRKQTAQSKSRPETKVNNFVSRLSGRN